MGAAHAPALAEIYLRNRQQSANGVTALPAHDDGLATSAREFCHRLLNGGRHVCRFRAGHDGPCHAHLNVSSVFPCALCGRSRLDHRGDLAYCDAPVESRVSGFRRYTPDSSAALPTPAPLGPPAGAGAVDLDAIEARANAATVEDYVCVRHRCFAPIDGGCPACAAEVRAAMFQDAHASALVQYNELLGAAVANTKRAIAAEAEVRRLRAREAEARAIIEAALAEPDARGAQWFVGRVLSELRGDNLGADLDGGDAQDWAVEAGLLEPALVRQPCGEDCRCVLDGNIPGTCYRYTDAARACVALSCGAPPKRAAEAPSPALPRFERLAAQFHADTGLLAPGKDVPAEMGDGQDYDARVVAWGAWLAEREVGNG